MTPRLELLDHVRSLILARAAGLDDLDVIINPINDPHPERSAIILAVPFETISRAAPRREGAGGGPISRDMTISVVAVSREAPDLAAQDEAETLSRIVELGLNDDPNISLTSTRTDVISGERKRFLIETTATYEAHDEMKET